MTTVKSNDGTRLYTPTVTRPKWTEVPKEAYWNREAVTIDDPLMITPKTIWKQGESIITSERTGETETITSSTRSVTVQDSSFYRRTTTFFWSICRDMWVSFGSLTGKILPECLQIKFGLRIENEAFDTPEAANTNVYSAFTTLRTQTKLKTSANDYYCRSLAENNTEIQYINDYLVGGKTQENPSQHANKLLIPVVLKGIPDHIVAVYITRTIGKDGKPTQATIEFYDSKGLTIADRHNQPLAEKPKMTLGMLIAELTDKYCEGLREDVWIDNDQGELQKELSVEENTEKQQWDSHNCGVYVCRYFAERLAGRARNEVCQEKVTYKDTWTWRNTIIKALIPALRAAIVEASKPEVECDEDELDAAKAAPKKKPVPEAVSRPTTPERSLLSQIDNEPNTELPALVSLTSTDLTSVLPISEDDYLDEDSDGANKIQIINLGELVDVPL